jgi:UDP-glucuronate 4-epimerase
MKKILVTGTAGFIGFHLAQRLLDRGDTVVGIDNINDYYDVNLKIARLKEQGISVDSALNIQHNVSTKYPNYQFYKLDLTDREGISQLFDQHQFDAVVNLAAQAGVRYSLTNPQAYIDANIQGFINILEPCRHHKVGHLVYASSSSVYGSNTKMPLSIHDNVDHPISLYAATKKSNELMAHTYSHLFNLPTTGLRFFTVYGPWGRPDMALFIFTKAITEGKPIQVFNHGNMVRDFTYVDDIVEGIIRVTDNPAQPNTKWDGQQPDPGTSKAPYRVYNIGNSNPVKLMDYIAEIEKHIGKEAIKEMMDIQPGDVPKTFSDVTDLENDLGYRPNTPISEGIGKFVQWYREFYRN